MKACISRVQDYKPKWNGNLDLPEDQQLTAKCSVFETGDLFDVLEAISKETGTEGVVDSDKLDVKQIRKLVKSAGAIVPKYVTLVGAEDFSIDDVSKLSPYFSLCVELLFQLVTISQPTEQDVKNSKPQPG